MIYNILSYVSNIILFHTLYVAYDKKQCFSDGRILFLITYISGNISVDDLLIQHLENNINYTIIKIHQYENICKIIFMIVGTVKWILEIHD